MRFFKRSFAFVAGIYKRPEVNKGGITLRLFGLTVKPIRVLLLFPFSWDIPLKVYLVFSLKAGNRRYPIDLFENSLFSDTEGINENTTPKKGGGEEEGVSYLIRTLIVVPLNLTMYRPRGSLRTLPILTSSKKIKRPSKR